MKTLTPVTAPLTPEHIAAVEAWLMAQEALSEDPESELLQQLERSAQKVLDTFAPQEPD